MTRLEALTALAEKVERGELRSVDWSFGAFPDGLSWDQVSGAFDGSLDAAQAHADEAWWSQTKAAKDRDDEQT